MEENNFMDNSFKSAEINEISAALSAFQGEVEQPALNKENPYFKSRYVDLSGVLKSAQKTMAKHGLSVAQIIVGNDIVTLLSHKSGQWFKSVCPIGNYKNQQDRGSAITYTKRYAICAMLGIAADTDDDGNSATDADKKAGGMQIAKTSAPAFTGAQLQQALDDLARCATPQDVSNVWKKWGTANPALCAKGTEFYKAVGEKSRAVQNAAQ